jgi:hypothetical protein
MLVMLNSPKTTTDISNTKILQHAFLQQLTSIPAAAGVGSIAGIFNRDILKTIFFFSRNIFQSYDLGDIEEISTELPTPYRNG